MVLVEYCLANDITTLESGINDLQVEFSPAACLEHCGKCRMTPFVIIDGTLYTGDDPATLVRNHITDNSEAES